MADQFVPKGQAVIEIMQATNYGRHAVEKKIDELVTRGQISYIDDPGDTRRKLMSRSSVQIVIDALTPRA